MLGLPEDGVRTRAHAALAALAPDRPAPVGEDGAVADWLLGQQDEAESGRTREAVAAIPAWRAWAAAVVERLGDVDGATLPAVPEPNESAGAAEPTDSKRARRPRPLRDGAAEPAAGEEPAAAKPAEGEEAETPAPVAAADERATEPRPIAGLGSEPAGRSSRVGGAVLIGVLVVLVGGVILLLFGRGNDDNGTPTASKASATATATATPQVVSQTVLKGVGNQAQGLMQVVKREADGKLVFVLAAEKVPQNRAKEVYAVWFTKKGSAPRNLGYAQAQVGKDGRFATGGPQQGQENDFAKWLTQYGQVVVARAGANSGSSKQPGQIVLRGTLPGGE
jgi:hypothetical protein